MRERSPSPHAAGDRYPYRMSHAPHRFIAHGRARGWSPRTLRQYRWLLGRLEHDLGHDLLDADTDELRAWLSGFDDRSQATRRAYTNALRSFYRWAADEGLLEHDPAARVVAPPNPDGYPRPIAEHDYRRAIAAADGRMLCWLLLGGDAGLRRAEIAGVCGRDVVGRRLHVLGKGGRARIVPLTTRLAGELVRAGALEQPGRLWPVTPNHVGRLVRDHLLGVGVDATTHQLRHRAITAYYVASGHDLLATARFSGHRSVQHVQRYCALDGDGLDVVDAMAA